MHLTRRSAIGWLSALPLATALPRGAGAADPMVVQGIPIDSGLELNYGEAGGLIQQSKLALSLELMANGSAAQAAVAAGSIQIGLSNVNSLATARERGLPLAILAPSAIYDSTEPTSLLMVPGDSPVRTARDLNGKTIAVNALNTIAQYGPSAWIAQNGGDVGSIRWLELAFAEMPVALDQHRVDAALVAEPALTIAKQHARVLANCYDSIAKRFVITAWYAMQPWIAANPDLARRFVALAYASARWANANRAQTAEVLVKVGHVEPNLVGQISRAAYAEHYDPALIVPQLAVTLKFGGLKAPMMPSDLVSPLA
jgi:NitT/TauT family transport system substrate-binding protein